MVIKLILLLSLLFTLQSFAKECKTKTINGCHYQDCRIKVGSYPQEVAILTPTVTTTNKIHYFFHGFRFNNEQTWRYDRSLDHVISGFQLARSVCKDQPEILIIPFSQGNNRDYRNYFTHAKIFDQFNSHIMTYLSLKDLEIELRLSGHSGAGKTIGIIAKESTFQINHITLYDALYSTQWSADLLLWLKKSEGKSLSLFAVAPNNANLSTWSQTTGESPYIFSRDFILSLKSNISANELNEQNAYQISTHYMNNYVQFIFQSHQATNHYSIVTQWWQ